MPNLLANSSPTTKAILDQKMVKKPDTVLYLSDSRTWGYGFQIGGGLEEGRALEAVLDVGSKQARVMGKLDETAVLAKERDMGLKNSSSKTVRNETKSTIRYLVGTGCDLALWHFPWLPKGQDPFWAGLTFLFKLQVCPKAQSKKKVLLSGDTKNLPPSRFYRASSHPFSL